MDSRAVRTIPANWCVDSIFSLCFEMTDMRINALRVLSRLMGIWLESSARTYNRWIEMTVYQRESGRGMWKIIVCKMGRSTRAINQLHRFFSSFQLRLPCAHCEKREILLFGLADGIPELNRLCRITCWNLAIHLFAIRLIRSSITYKIKIGIINFCVHKEGIIEFNV